MGIFGKLFGALKKTKDGLSTKMRMLFSKNKLGDEFYEELEEILISADVSVATAEKVVEGVKERAMAERLKDADYVTGLLKEVLTNMLRDAEVPEIGFPCVIMVVGVNGVGKTTTIGKLANYYISHGKSVTVAAADTFRAAAIDQLAVWCERAGVEMVKQSEGSDPAAVVFDAIAVARKRAADVLIIDTAGRLQNKKNLMNELAKIDRVIDRELPGASRETLLVLDATTGQNAVSQAKEFSQAANITGITLNKLDGTAKGGIVIAIKQELGIPVKFIGVGEKIDDMQEFDAADFVRALFGE